MKISKVILAASLCMLAALTAAGSAFAETWLDAADTKWFDDAPAGTGTTEALPLYISTPEQLAGIAKICKDVDGGERFVGKFVALSCDIDLSGREWRPIGWFLSTTNRSHFQGTFDGRGHKITGMSVKAASGAGEPDYRSSGYGLFSQIGPKAVIKNLRVDGSVRGDSTNKIEFGAILSAHINASTVSNVVVSGDVEVSHGRGYAGGLAAAGGKQDVHNVVAYGEYSSKGMYNYAGGLVGYGNHQQIGQGTYTRCVSMASVTTSGNNPAYGLGSGMTGDLFNSCKWLSIAGDERYPKLGAVHADTNCTECAPIKSGAEAPVTAVLLGDDITTVKELNAAHGLKIATYPAGASATGVKAEWSFDDASVTAAKTDEVSVSARAATAGEKWFTVTVSGVDGIAGNIELRGRVLFLSKAHTMDAPVEWSGSGSMTFTSDADLDDFVSVELDGAVLARDRYTVASGSTKVTLAEGFLSGLAKGAHELKIVSETGYAASTFSVTEPADPTKSGGSGGGGCDAFGGAMAVIASMAALALLKRIK